MSGQTEDSEGKHASAPQVPDFDLLECIGEGGFGQVWLARNRTTGRLRAVKLIPLRGKGSADPAGREIVSLRHLEMHVGREHPNLTTIHHVGKTAHHLFYVMDLADDVAGGGAPSAAGYRPATLDSRLRRGPLSPQECLACARQLLAGLACLHAAGMVHRDVKPANCLFVDGRLKLADFGLLTEADRQASRLGTERYMPPDGRMDTRADVYAAGLVIYEMLTGLPAESFPRLGRQAHLVVADPVLAKMNLVVLKACQPDPGERFRDAREMLAALDATEPQAGRRRVLVGGGIAAAVGLLACAGALAAWWFRPDQPARVHVNFLTDPFEATVYLDGKLQREADGTPYRTPCTIPNLSPQVHHVAFQREGLKRLEAGEFDFRSNREIFARWNSEP